MSRAALAAVALALAAPAAAQAPADYRMSSASILALGRSASALVVAGKADALYARFAPEFKAAVKRDELAAILRSTRGAAPIGPVVGESALPLGAEQRVYSADRRWGSRVLAIVFLFDSRGRIDGGTIQERKRLAADPRAGYRQRVRLRLPFDGTWWIFWGGNTERQNYHVVAPDQRHAWDIVVWKNGSTHRGGGARVQDYWAWNRPILAPAAGKVIEAVDGLPDNVPGKMDPKHAAGNHVILDLGHGEYALLAHMRRGSIAVKVGDRVRAGRQLGHCGNSGNTSEPHLHIHVQDRPKLFQAHGLPVEFSSYAADGRGVAHGVPLQGQFVRNGG